MHKFTAKITKILDICKKFAGNLVNKFRNMPRSEVVPRFSDLEKVALSIADEWLGIDSENYLFQRNLTECKQVIPNFISRRQFNNRRR